MMVRATATDWVKASPFAMMMVVMAVTATGSCARARTSPGPSDGSAPPLDGAAGGTPIVDAAGGQGAGGTAGTGIGAAGAGAAGVDGGARDTPAIGGTAGNPGLTGGRVDTIVFGDTASEIAHGFDQRSTQVLAGALGQPARQCLPLVPAGVDGGDLTFVMKVDPARRNYVTVKFWGGDGAATAAGAGSDMGRLYLYVVAGGVSYQVGYRHEGDYPPLNVAPSKPALPGRFFYSTSLLPLAMTLGKTSVTLKIVSTGRIYALGSGVAPVGNYQYLMASPGRAVYRAYTHTEALLVPSGELQGAAPSVTVRPTPGEEVMGPGGSFFSAVNNHVNNRLSTAVSITGFTTTDVLYLARAYTVSGLTSYHNAGVVAQVISAIDAFAADFFITPTTAVSGGGNEGWGGRYGNLGWAIHLLRVQLAPTLDATVNYGATGGNRTRRAAWGELLLASRDFGRMSRDTRYITNQSLIANASIFMANQGLLDLGNAAAFTNAAAARYLREAIGLSPWRGSDLLAGGSSDKYGPSYFQVTRKGLTREWGYVGISYGEMQWYAANFFVWTGDVAFREQAIKMQAARAPFRRPAIELGPGGANYRAMEGIGLLAWRGAPESDGDFADEIAYGDRTGAGALGMRVAAVTLNAAAVGYAKQMLADNQYFGALANALITEPMVLEAFADYQVVKAAPDSGIRLPMTDGEPDFAWADEEDGIVAIKRGDERLWIAPYYQAKAGTGVNGIARFHYSTPAWDQFGVTETSPQFRYAATFVRPNLIDKPEGNLYVPPDSPTQAYAGEKLPLAATDLTAVPANPNGANYDPFRGKADFYATQFGGFLIGLNTSATISATLRLPPGVAAAADLVAGGMKMGDVGVPPLSTVVLLAPYATGAVPVPATPLLLLLTTATRNQITLTWSPSSGAASYAVKRSATRGGPAITIAKVTSGTTYADDGLAAATPYFYRVSAVNASGESYDSMEAAGATTGP